MPKIPKPTQAELAILRVLWQRGPSTVRQVQDGLVHGAAVGYTTILKLLQIMTEKGLVARDVVPRTHIYSAGVSEQTTQKNLVSDLLERAFGGSSLGLVQQALAAKRLSPEELEQIQAWIDSHKGGEA